MKKRTLTCIGCPLGCAVTVELDNGDIILENAAETGVNITATKEIISSPAEEQRTPMPSSPA